MSVRVGLLLLSLTLISACTHTEKGGPTLGSLETRTIVIEESDDVSLDVSKAVNAYQDIISSGQEQALSAKAMHRLGDLEMKKIDFIVNEELLEPKAYETAISWYEKLLTSSPNYEGKEAVLYQLARAYEGAGRVNQALGALRMLTEQYPDSEYLLEAGFRRGEILFQSQEFAEASRAYGIVINKGAGTPFYEKSLFKYGWSVYKQDDCAQAQNAFLALIDLKLGNDRPPSELSRMMFLSKADRELVNDSFHAFNLCFYGENGPQALTDYLAVRPVRLYEFMFYQKLAEDYLKQERYLDAAEAYSAFYYRSPWHTYSVLMHGYAIDIYRERGYVDKILPAKEEFFSRYLALGDQWQGTSHNTYVEYLIQSDTVSQDQIKSRLKIYLADIANAYHARAQKKKTLEAYREAAGHYRDFLKHFGDSKEAPEMNFLLAETLFEGKGYTEAAREYERTAYNYGNHPRAVEAGYAALMAYEEQDKRLQPQGKTAWNRRALNAALSFAKIFNHDPRAPMVLARAAEEFYKNKSYNDAIFAAQTVIDRYPKADKEIRRSALHVMANTQFEMANYEIAELFYAELRELMDKDDGRMAEIRERIAACIYKQAEQLRSQGVMRMAINEFRRLIRTVPDSSVTPIAKYDMAAVYIVLKEWQEALDLLEGFRKQYPKHPLINDAEEKVAVAYMNLSRPAEAAVALEGIANVKTDASSQRQLLWQAAELYAEGDKLEKAAQTYVHYAEVFSSPLEQAVEALHRASAIYKKMDKTYEYRVQLEKIYNADLKGRSERTDRTRYLAAESAFILAEPYYERYARVELVEPIRKNMALKNTYMKSALEAYNKASDLNVSEYTTAATYRIAAMYEDFGRKLMASERPRNLDEEELEQYEIMLEEQAYPFEEKAINLYESNTGHVPSIYNDWIKKSFEALARLIPARYAKREIYVSTITLE